MKRQFRKRAGAARRLLPPAVALALFLAVFAGGIWARTAEQPAGAPASGEQPFRSQAAAYQAGFRLAQLDGGGANVLWSGLLLLLAAPALGWMLFRGRHINAITSPGFEIITTSETRRFIPLDEKFQHMDFLAAVETRGALRLSANLNKVNLSFRRYGYLLEDKNFRNALLVNRRRVRRTLLRDGDVLDLGDLTLLYRDNRQVPIIRHSAVTPPEGKVQIKFDRVRGPVRKGTPVLVSDQSMNRNFYITKNLVYLGRSESNDLIIKSQSVDYRHAKIERVGSRYKLLDLSATGSTYVNNRRVEQRMLKEGDEISIDSQRFKFQLVTKNINESQQSAPAPREIQESGGGEPDRAEQSAQAAED